MCFDEITSHRRDDDDDAYFAGRNKRKELHVLESREIVHQPRGRGRKEIKKREKEKAKKVSTQKRINYTIFYVTSYIAYYGFGIVRIREFLLSLLSYVRLCNKKEERLY